MLRNAIVRTITFSLALVFGLSSVFASVPAAKTFNIEAADLDSTQTRVVNYEGHAYKMNLAEGQRVVVTIKTMNLADLKITTGEGKVITRKGERYYRVELTGTGATTVELSSITQCPYSIQFKQN